MEVRDQIVRHKPSLGQCRPRHHAHAPFKTQSSKTTWWRATAQGFFIYDVEYTTIRRNLIVDNTVGVPPGCWLHP